MKFKIDNHYKLKSKAHEYVSTTQLISQRLSRKQFYKMKNYVHKYTLH